MSRRKKNGLTYGVVTANEYEDLNYEKKCLFDTAKKYFDDVLLIDTHKVYYKFIRGNELPIIIYGKKDISNLSAINIRSTKNREASTALLAHSLNLCGCVLNDPVTRFSVGYASKLLSTSKRFKNKTGSSSFLAFDLESSKNLIKDIHKEKLFPLVAKPIGGSKGIGVVLIKNKKEANEYAEEFFEHRATDDTPIFLQTFVRFVKEYRIMVIDKKAVNIVRKIKPEDKITANAAQGGIFVKEENDAIIEFVTNNLTEEGIYGVDVAVDENGDFHIIEANRAPMWETFEETLVENIAEIIVQDALEKIEKKKLEKEKGEEEKEEENGDEQSAKRQ